MKHKLLIVLFTAFVFFSCENNVSFVDERNDVQEKVMDSEHFIDLNSADSIASFINFSTLDKEGKTKSIGTKEIEEVKPILDEDANIVYYAINYKNGGFIILSADTRVNPVMAYSEKNRYPIEETAYPNGLIDWMAEAKDMIKEIRFKNIEQTIDVARSWEAEAISETIIEQSTENVSPLSFRIW